MIGKRLTLPVLTVDEAAIYVDALDAYIRMTLNCLQTDDTRLRREIANIMLEDLCQQIGEAFCCSYIGTAQHSTGYGSNG